MSSTLPGPDEKAESRGNANAPGAPLRPRSSMPATESDFNRFPEHAEMSQITSLINPDPPKVGDPAGAQPPPPTPSTKGQDASPSANPDFDPQIEIERRIGVGGMGEVFLGLQKHLGRKVAVKRIRDWGEDAQNKDRFIHEAKAQACLQHPGIAQVYDFREAQGALYLIMEHVEGKTLEELLKTEGKFAPPRIAQIGIQLTEALESAAHEGYIHRDLKPANVMLTEDGKVKIIDFGLALRFRNLMRTRFTQKGDILGTPAYMSPEQLNQEENLEVRSDIWSLGVLLYALATGGPPFIGKDFVCTVKNVMMEEPAPLPAIEEAFPLGLWEVIKRALRKDRAERWQDYASFRAAMLPYAESSEGKHAPSRSVSPEARKPRPRLTVATIVLGFSAVLALAVGSRFWGLPKEHSIPAGKGRDVREAGPTPTLGENLPGEKVSANSRSEEKGKVGPTPPPEAIAKVDPPAPRLREKLFKWTPSERAQAAIGEIAQRFSRRRSALAAYSYDEIQGDLQTTLGSLPKGAPEEASPEEREYVTAHAEQAKALTQLAKSTVAARLAEFRPGSEIIFLRLRTGSPISGSVVKVEPGSITLRDEKGNVRSVEIAEIAPDEFLSKAAAPAAEIAVRALAFDPAGALRSALDHSEESDELLLWIPILVRLARFEVAASVMEAASQAKDPLIARQPLEGRQGLVSQLARADRAAKILADGKPRVLGFYPYLQPEFELAAREKEALGLLVNGAFSKVLAGFPSTGAYLVAGQILVRRFQDELAVASEELLADGAWYDQQWKVFPPVRELSNPSDYFLPGYKERPLLFRDPDGLRKLVLGKIGLRVEEGVFLTLSFKPLGTELDRSHWEFLLRGRERSENFLRVDERTIALCRSVLTPGAKDIVLYSAALPQSGVEKKYKTFVFLPGEEHLHIFVDGEIVLSIPREDAAIPKQLSFHVYSGEASVRTMQAKRAPTLGNEGRK
jgi:serine/threonine protein kinase